MLAVLERKEIIVRVETKLALASRLCVYELRRRDGWMQNEELNIRRRRESHRQCIFLSIGWRMHYSQDRLPLMLGGFHLFEHPVPRYPRVET